MIYLLGDHLYQWDGNRQVLLDGEDAEAETVSFAHYGSTCSALVVEVQEVDGNKVADIPNMLLQCDADIYAWTWADTKTISAKRLSVKPRNRPADYMYVPTKVIAMEQLKEWIEELLGDIDFASNYELLSNKPSIEGVELIGDRKMDEFGLKPITSEHIQAQFID